MAKANSLFDIQAHVTEYPHRSKRVEDSTDFEPGTVAILEYLSSQARLPPKANSLGLLMQRENVLTGVRKSTIELALPWKLLIGWR